MPVLFSKMVRAAAIENSSGSFLSGAPAAVLYHTGKEKNPVKKSKQPAYENSV